MLQAVFNEDSIVLGAKSNNRIRSILSKQPHDLGHGAT